MTHVGFVYLYSTRNSRYFLSLMCIRCAWFVSAMSLLSRVLIASKASERCCALYVFASAVSLTPRVLVASKTLSSPEERRRAAKQRSIIAAIEVPYKPAIFIILILIWLTGRKVERFYQLYLRQCVESRVLLRRYGCSLEIRSSITAIEV